MRARTVL